MNSHCETGGQASDRWRPGALVASRQIYKDQMKAVIKKVIGKSLIQIGSSWPNSKPFLKALGIRTSEPYFCDRAVSVQTQTGHTLRLTNLNDSYLSFQVFWKGTVYYEPITTLVIQELLEPGATFVDVGANVGFFSLIASLTTPGIDVIAFEPNPKNVRIFNENVVANNLKNIRCEPLALSDTIGTATLYLNTSDMSASLLSDFQDDFNPATDSVQTQTTTLDCYFEQHGTPNKMVLKVDVEGHEVALLRGARRVLADCGPDLILEVLKPYPDEANVFLKQFGYHFYQITDEGLLPSETLVSVRHGDLFFLNYLISKKSEPELQPISEKIIAMVKDVDLYQTSKYFGPGL